MSTITAVNPPLSLDGPLPVAPAYGLLNLPGVERPQEAHAAGGANFWMYPCLTALPHDPCSGPTGTLDSKEEGDGAGEQFAFYGYTAYASMICSSISVGTDWDGFASRVERAFEAVESAAVELELATGTAVAVSPSYPAFADSNVTVLGGGAVTPAIGLRWLEYAIGQSQKAGVIHAPPEVTAAWRADELVVHDDFLFTLANDTPVVSGPGYQGVVPTGQGAVPSGDSWAFATGPVQLRRGDLIRLDTYKNSLDRSDNTVVVRAERDYLASWDPCVQAAVLIDWT